MMLPLNTKVLSPVDKATYAEAKKKKKSMCKTRGCCKAEHN